MLILLRVLAALGLLVLALAGAGYLLPREVTVERSVTIAASPEAEFPHLNSPRLASAIASRGGATIFASAAAAR